MRESLLTTFDSIQVINVHGDANKKETCPDGSTDNNVFDIMQGVSIIVMSKTKDSSDLGQLHYAELFGKRAAKYEALVESSINSDFTKPIDCVAPYYFFTPRDFKNGAQYSEGFSLSEILP